MSSASVAIPAIASSNISNPERLVSQLSNNSKVSQGKEFIASPASYSFAKRSLSVAKLLPRETLGFLMLDLDLNSWQLFGQSPQISPVAAIAKFLEMSGLDSPISFVKDIQPWLSTEVAIAVLSSSEGQALPLILSPITDGTKFDTFLTKLDTLNLPKPTETLYQNIKILEWQLPAEPPQKTEPESPESTDSELEVNEAAPVPNFSFIPKQFAIAKLTNGTAVFSTNRQGIQNLIDTTEADSLAVNPLFLRSLNNPLWNRSLLAGYGDFKEIGKISELIAQEVPETSIIPGFNRAEYLQGLRYTLGQYSSFDLFTWATPKGIRSQSNSYFSEVRPPQPKDKEPRDHLLSYLPANVYGIISSRNLNRQWQWFIEESKLQPSYKIFVEGLRMVIPFLLGGEIDIDIEKDFISWIDGEYALVGFPSPTSPFAQFGGDFTMGLLLRTSKPDAANLALEKLTKYLQKQDLQVKKRQVGVIPLTSLEFADNTVAGKTQSVFAYGWRDRQTLLLTFGAATAAEFIPIPKEPLSKSAMFREIIADMPQPNFGYFYLNAKAIAEKGAMLFLTFMPDLIPSETPSNQKNHESAELPPEIQRVIDKLGGLVFVYSETSDRFQADFAIELKP
ncbi:DUF3352 domain-containing protein [Pseudanabaena biceps]|nr:DUF3352 domain-containing protein [Pseudanabaena biceps]